MNDIKCDRCGQPADFYDGNGGNCPQCGDDLCISCAGKWYGDDGICDKCYNENHLKTREFQRPKAPLIGADGNIFFLLGIASQTLKDNGFKEQAKEMFNRVTNSGSYQEALAIIQEYVEPVER